MKKPNLEKIRKSLSEGITRGMRSLLNFLMTGLKRTKGPREYIDKTVTRIKAKTGKPLFIAIIFVLAGMLLFIPSGNIYGTVATLLCMALTMRSRTLWRDLVGVTCIVACAAYTYTSDATVSVIIGICAGIIAYALSLACESLARQNQIFTSIKMNEWAVVETGEGKPKEYIGMSDRWVDNKGRTVAPEKKPEDSSLVRYTCDPVTGKIIEGRESLSFAMNHYLIDRLGIYPIGLPGIVKMKTWSMEYKKVESGKIKTKIYKNDSAVRSLFDSFTYLFRAPHLETASTAAMFLEAQVLMYADNLQTPSYGALPAGIWINRAEEEFIDIVRAHVANSDYGKILKERAYDESKMTPEEVAAHQEAHRKLRESIYTELMSDKSKKKFIAVCGYYPVSILIHDMGLEGNKEYREALVLSATNKALAEAGLVKQVGLTNIAKEAIETEKNLRDGKLHSLMAPVDAAKAYVDAVIAPVKDNPEALSVLKVKEIATMKNLSVLGGDASMILNPQAKTQKEDEK